MPATVATETSVLWYRGICDQALWRVEWWLFYWPRGDVAATRPKLELDGVHDVVTKRAVKVPWRSKELEHIVRILRGVRPVWGLTVYMEQVLSGHKKSRLLSTGGYLCTMISEYEDISDIRQVLIEVRDGTAGLFKHTKEAEGPLWKF